MAILSGHCFKSLDGITISGTYLVSAFKSCAAINFLIASIETGASIFPLVHAASQRLLQMRPQIARKGLSFLIRAKAS